MVGSGLPEETESQQRANVTTVNGLLPEGKMIDQSIIWNPKIFNFLFRLRRAQPDNREQREGGEDEACIAVLNNFYADGIKWHDVNCDHKKPIICEEIPELLDFVNDQ